MNCLEESRNPHKRVCLVDVILYFVFVFVVFSLKSPGVAKIMSEALGHELSRGAGSP